MKIAYSLLPDRFEDKRHETFKQGLREVGYEVVEGRAEQAGHGDLILGWNAYGTTYDQMRNADKHGAQSMVFEEGYVRNIHGEKYFAVALGGHNGHGRWNVGGPERLAGWNLHLEPWRRHGNHILVCGQRGFGYNAMAMPTDWPDKIVGRLRTLTNRPIYFRPHPKRRATMPKSGAYDKVLDFGIDLKVQLSDAWACVVYTSNSATNALLAGVPALFDGPDIVTSPASLRGIESVDRPPLLDRTRGLQKMSWAQWSEKELRTGVAFKCLLK